MLTMSIILCGCSYFKDRVNDSMDIIKLSADVGIGVSAYAHLGLIGIGTGLWNGNNYGFGRKDSFGTIKEQYLGVPVSQIAGITHGGHYALSPWLTSVVFIKSDRYNIRGKYTFTKGYFLVWPVLYYDEDNNYDCRANISSWMEYFWIEVSARIFVGTKIGVNLAEIVDFVLGIFTIDIGSDDFEYIKPVPQE